MLCAGGSTARRAWVARAGHRGSVIPEGTTHFLVSLASNGTEGRWQETRAGRIGWNEGEGGAPCGDLTQQLSLARTSGTSISRSLSPSLFLSHSLSLSLSCSGFCKANLNFDSAQGHTELQCDTPRPTSSSKHRSKDPLCPTLRANPLPCSPSLAMHGPSIQREVFK